MYRKKYLNTMSRTIDITSKNNLKVFIFLPISSCLLNWNWSKKKYNLSSPTVMNNKIKKIIIIPQTNSKINKNTNHSAIKKSNKSKKNIIIKIATQSNKYQTPIKKINHFLLLTESFLRKKIKTQTVKLFNPQSNFNNIKQNLKKKILTSWSLSLK